MPVKAALVGAGGWGETHFLNWKLLAEQGVVDFCGVADVNPANLERAKAAGIPVFSSDTEMYEAVRPDAVSIAAGIPAHLPLLVNAMNHGVSVLMEKPAAVTEDVAKAMIFTSQCHPELFALIAFQFLYTPETEAMKKLLLSGQSGELKKIKVRCAVARNDAYYSRNNWAGRIFMPGGAPVYDSPLSNAFAHYLNLALFVSGPDMESCSRIETLEDVRLFRARRGIENFDSCDFVVNTDGNVAVHVSMSHTVEKTEWPNLTFEFDSGSKLVWTPSEWILFSASGTPVQQNIFKNDPQYEMFRSVALLAAGEGAPHQICTLETALEHTRCVEAVQAYPVETVKGIYHPENGGFYTI